MATLNPSFRIPGVCRLSQKLTAEEAAELSTHSNASQHSSAWNKAGTFEERDYTSWAKDRLKVRRPFCQRLLVTHASQKTDPTVRSLVLSQPEPALRMRTGAFGWG